MPAHPREEPIELGLERAEVVDVRLRAVEMNRRPRRLRARGAEEERVQPRDGQRPEGATAAEWEMERHPESVSRGDCRKPGRTASHPCSQARHGAQVSF